MDAKRPTLRHIVIKMPKVKDKERVFKVAREKQRVIYEGVPVRLCRLEGIGKKYSVMKSKDIQRRLLYLAKLSSKMERPI